MNKLYLKSSEYFLIFLIPSNMQHFFKSRRKKTNGHIMAVKKGCEHGLYEFNGRCVGKCPEKYYPSNLETKLATAEELYPMRNVCLQCHYSCKFCGGSNDYQCTQCYPDAVLTNVSTSEAYCYPISITDKIADEVWFFRVAILLFVVILVTLCIVCVLVYTHYKQKRSQKRNRFFKKNILRNIRNMEEKVKTTVYSEESD